MADKVKTKKPMIKVEEIDDDAVMEDVKEPNVPESETPKETSEIDSTAPTVSSFSQLDSPPPAPAEEKKSILTDTTDKTTMGEEVSPEVVPQAESEPARLPEKQAEESSQKENISSDEVKEWLKDVRPDTTKEVEKGRGLGGRFIAVAVIVLLILGAIVGGVMYFQKGVEDEVPVTEENTAVQTTETVTPTPTEEEVDLTGVTISILNGSGIAGEAGKVKNLLTEGGFTTDKIQAGNADSYNYEDISVSVKSDLSKKVYEAINSALSDVYDVKLSEDELQDNSSFDVVIIVGK
jgi:hypothetical protein